MTAARLVGPGRVAFFAELRFMRQTFQSVAAALAGRAAALVSDDVAEIAAFTPHVLVLSAGAELIRFRRLLPNTVIGLIDHGMLRKGRVRRMRMAALHAGGRFDFVCVSDEVTAATYTLAAAAREQWLTGHPLLDSLFRGDPPPPMPLDPAQPTVLFVAPALGLVLDDDGVSVRLCPRAAGRGSPRQAAGRRQTLSGRSSGPGCARSRRRRRR